jgi:hypothetical protein
MWLYGTNQTENKIILLNASHCKKKKKKVLVYKKILYYSSF